jgi:hypothetical protein
MDLESDGASNDRLSNVLYIIGLKQNFKKRPSFILKTYILLKIL